MYIKINVCISICLLSISSLSCQTILPKISPDTIVDTYHGHEIIDPYRNLENLKDSVVINWLEQQGVYARKVLKKIPGRQKIINKQLAYDKKKTFDIIKIKSTSNGAYFYLKSYAEEDKYKLYYRKQRNGKEFLLYDPSTFSKTDEYRINYFQPDWNGKKIAISLSKKGEEASKIIIQEVLTKKIFPQIIQNCIPTIGGIQWKSDNSGFIYLHFPIMDPTSDQYWMNTRAVVYIIGNNPNELIDVFSKTNNPKINLKAEDLPFVYNYNPYDKYIFARVGGVSSFYDMYYKKEENLTSKQDNWRPLCKQKDKIEKIVFYANKFIFLSAKDPSNYKICETSVENIDFNSPKTLVSQKNNEIITDFIVTDYGIFFTTKKNSVEARLFYYKNNIIKEIALPNPSGKIEIESLGQQSDFIKVSIGGYTSSTSSYYYDIHKNIFTLENISPDFENSDFNTLTVDEIEIPSHDGVLVPLSIIRDKNYKKNGDTRVLFYGYGSYGSPGTPFFDPSLLLWVKKGGIVAIAHVRGGGEKGDLWHKAGYKITKPNTWKDMIACTEYMIKEGYTNSGKCVIWGTSAGGILAGRAMTDRPDLYSAVILTSPATNMLRSEIQPNGKNSIKEFGTVKIKEEFEALLEMDSYHHIKKGVKYPATYVTGGLKDGRVVIWDHAKFVARLQASNSSRKPILFNVSFEDGHAGMNNSNQEIYEKYADALSFALWQTGHPEYQPKE